MVDDFKIVPGKPDGIKITVEYYVDDWDEVNELMKKLDAE